MRWNQTRRQSTFIRHVDAMDHCSMVFKVHEIFKCELCKFVVREGRWLKSRCSECLLPKTCCRSDRSSVLSSRQWRHWEGRHWSGKQSPNGASTSEHSALTSTSITGVSSSDGLVADVSSHDWRGLRGCRSWRVHSKVKSSIIEICRARFPSDLTDGGGSKKAWAIRARFS